MCASCKPVNGMLPADGSWCFGHGTHVASTVGGRNFGVAKEVTIVPVSVCPTSPGFTGSDIKAGLECAPRHTCAAAATPASRPCSHGGSPAPTAAPPSLLQVGADRLRSAPQRALRDDPGYTQRRHASRHLALSTPWAMAKGSHGPEASRSACLTSPGKPLTSSRGPLSRRRLFVRILRWTGSYHGHYTRLQILQRSLSGGYLTYDAALLKANARSMFNEAGH